MKVSSDMFGVWPSMVRLRVAIKPKSWTIKIVGDMTTLMLGFEGLNGLGA